MREHPRRIVQPEIQGILVSIVLWLSLAITTWIAPDISRIFSRILSGIIVGSTASLISYYVLSLPENTWIPWKAHRNILSFLYTLYALFFYCLSMIISQGSLFGLKLNTTIGLNPTFIIIASFLIGIYMTLGSILDEVISDSPRYVWLGLLITASVYIFIAGILVKGLSIDILFVIALATARIGTSLAFGKLISRGFIYGRLSVLKNRFIILNLLVLPITALLSK